MVRRSGLGEWDWGCGGKGRWPFAPAEGLRGECLSAKGERVDDRGYARSDWVTLRLQNEGGSVRQALGKIDWRPNFLRRDSTNDGSTA